MDFNDTDGMAQYKKDLTSAEATLRKLQDAIDDIGESQLNELKSLNQWVVEQGFRPGKLEPVFPQKEAPHDCDVDLVWREGLGAVNNQPVVVLLNRHDFFINDAVDAGFMCFSSVDDFQIYATSLCG